MNDVTVWPGSSTSPPSDPRRETVWYGLAANGASANGASANRGVAGFPEIRFYPHKRIPRSADPILSTQRICQIYDVVKNLMGAMLIKIVIILRENEPHMAKNLVF